jgi:hypothetical protein
MTMPQKSITAENSRLRRENGRLASHLEEANQQILELRKKLEFFELHERLVAGMRGETIIAKITGGIPTAVHADHDLYLPAQDLRLEIKFAHLTMASTTNKVMRWEWSCVFGRGGAKEYDRLILVGDTNTLHRSKYMDPDSPYIIFDVPFDEVMSISQSGGNSGRMIRLSQNPLRCFSVSKPLFDQYQITGAELKTRYNFEGAVLQ